MRRKDAIDLLNMIDDVGGYEEFFIRVERGEEHGDPILNELVQQFRQAYWDLDARLIYLIDYVEDDDDEI